MSTSGTFSFSVTRNQIITQAMLDIGEIGEGETPTAQEVSDCAFKLNMLVKQWQGKQDFAPGLKMWTRQRGDLFLGYSKYYYQLGPTGDNWDGGFTPQANGNALWTPPQNQELHNRTTLNFALPAGTTLINVASVSNMALGDYVGIQCGSDIFWTTITFINTSGGNYFSIAAGLSSAAGAGAYVWNYTTKQQQPLEIVTCVLRDQYRTDIPMNKMTIEEYEALPTKTQSGFVSDPTSFYYEPTLTNGNFYIDCAGEQDVTKHLHIVFLQEIMDLNNPTDNPEFPQQWYRALTWGLGRDIAPMFDAEWTQNMEANYTEALSMARETIAETTAMYFQPYGEV